MPCPLVDPHTRSLSRDSAVSPVDETEGSGYKVGVSSCMDCMHVTFMLGTGLISCLSYCSD